MSLRSIKIVLLVMLILCTGRANSQIISANVLTSPNPLSNQVNSGTYELIELGFKMDASTNYMVDNGTLNPYNPDEIDIWGVLTDAQTSQEVKKVYGFYMKEYDTDPDGQAINLSGVQRFNWRMRFVIEEDKHYKLTLFTKRVGMDITQYGTVYDIYGANSGRHGYLRFPNGHSYMQFTDGTPFFAVGETLPPYSSSNANAWDYTTNTSTGIAYPTNTVRGLNGIVDEFSSVGGNFLKYYFAPDALEIEWTVLGNYNDYQNRAQDLDKIVAHMESRNVYMQFGLWTWEQFNPDYFSTPGIDWHSSPYKMIPGVNGPVDVYVDFNNCTSNSSALDYLKRKIRYCIARWGYSPSVASIELMTEIDRIRSDANNEYWVGGCYGTSNNVLIDNALIDLGAYVKDISSRMLVTSGVASYYGSGGTFFRSPICDYVDVHSYFSNFVNGGAEPAYISEWLKKEYGKPFHIGECGSGFNEQWYGSIADINGDDLDNQTQFSNPMWSTAFSGAFGNAMFFGGYGYIHTDNPGWGDGAYQKFRAFSNFFSGEDLNEVKYKSIRNKVQGGLTLNCTGNWATPECLSSPPTIYPHQNIYAYNVNNDQINALAPGSTAQIETSDDDNIEVYALQSAKKIMGWVHNKSNYFYNLPHQSGQTGPTSYSAYMMHPLPNGLLESNPNQQHYEYVTDLYDKYMTIKGLDCSGPYRMEWYRTRAGGGLMPLLTINNLSPANGQITVPIPDLKAISTSHNDLPDYAFKVVNDQDDSYSTAAGWTFDYVNQQSVPIEQVTSLAFTKNNRMYYRGVDDKLHCYYYDEHCWEESEVPVWGPNDQPDDQNVSTFATTADNKLFYRNKVGRMEQIYEIAPTGNTPNWIAYMHTSAPMVHPVLSTIKEKNGSIYYVSDNNYVTELYWDGSQWQSTEINWAQQVNGAYVTYNSFDVSPDRKVFYPGANGKIEQLWWDVNTNSWISYTHNNAPDAAPGSDIKITPDGRVVYQTVNNYIGILDFNQATQQWFATEINWIPQINVNYGLSHISVNSGSQIFYGNANGKLQEIYWGNYQGTYQWIGYTSWIDYNGGKMVISSDSKMFYFTAAGDMSQVYYDATTSSWIQYIHPGITPRVLPTLLYIDQYDKVFYANDADQLLSVLWWDDPCRKYPPCTYTNYRIAPVLIGEQEVSQDDLHTQAEGRDYSTAIEQQRVIDQFQVYPNPSVKGKFYVKGFINNIRAEVKNIHGQVVFDGILTSKESYIDLSGRANGVYLLTCTDGERTETHRLVLSQE